MGKFKPVKRSPIETDNPIIRGIDSLIEYEVNANYCNFHSPKIALEEKEIEK